MPDINPLYSCRTRCISISGSDGREVPAARLQVENQRRRGGTANVAGWAWSLGVVANCRLLMSSRVDCRPAGQLLTCNWSAITHRSSAARRRVSDEHLDGVMAWLDTGWLPSTLCGDHWKSLFHHAMVSSSKAYV